MKIKIEQILLVFLVSLSFFRIDLAAGMFSFLVTPPFLLSGLIIFFFLGSLSNKRSFRAPLVTFSCLLIIMVSYFFSTIFFNYKGSLQFKRFFLFFEIILTCIAFLFLFDKVSASAKKSILQKWIKYSINAHLIWISVQVFLFIQGYHYYGNSWSEWNFINPLPHTIGYYFPRLEGGFLDPNVCGYYYSFLFFLSRMLKVDNRRNNFLLILFVLLTISRSAIAAFIICLFVFNFQSIKISIKKVITGSVFFIASVALTGGLIKFLGYWDYFIKAILIRFNEKESTSLHSQLIELGFNETIKYPDTFIFGNGFSSSPYFAYEILKGVGGNKWKYANFHSEYITMFFETGIIGFLLYYTILAFPFIYTKKSKIKLLPILLLILLQGVFYQQYNFHYYWIVLAIVLTLNIKDNVAQNE